MAEIKETVLTDRQILLHVLSHIEDMSVKVDKMWEIYERCRPLLDRFLPAAGPADMVSFLQARREGRRGRRGS